MNFKKYLNKIPFGIIFGISLMIISLIAFALTVVNIVSSEMIKTVGGDDGLSKAPWILVLWVVLIILIVVAIACITFMVIKSIENKKNNIKKENKFRSVFTLISSYSLVLFLISVIAGNVMDGFKKQINSALGLTGTRTEIIEGSEDEDLEYFKSDYVKKDKDGNPLYEVDSNGYKHQVYDDEALYNAGIKKSHQVQQEGTTILWNNDSNGLPLAKNSKVSLLSRSSVDWVYSGGGSGYAYTKGAVNLKKSLENAGLTINKTLWDFYSTGAGSSYVRSARYLMNEVPWSKYTTNVLDSFSSYNDAAIITLSRQAGEGSVAQGGAFDVTTKDADTPSGDYYDMSFQERTLLSEVISLKKSGVFKKVIVLLNTPTGMWFENLLANKDDIDACVWVCQTGFDGLSEVGRILVGDSNPSGHLVDTFLYNTQTDPAFENSIAVNYTNANSMGLTNVAYQGTYIAYLENIYVGYKYYETRYEDTVLNQGNASSTAGVKDGSSSWNYQKQVAFPFGYGLSYTTFEYSNFSVVKDASDDYIVSLTVKNIGNREGKDAVQVYLQKPYTDYDRTYAIEQSSVNLVGYYKTKTLNPNESENIQIKVDDELLKTYDANNKKTYIREAGSYYLTASKDAHEAINNILAKKGKTPSNTGGIMDKEGNSNFVYQINFANDDYLTYKTSLVTGYEITNQFDDTDWNKYVNKTEGNVTYLSRNNWDATYPKTPLSLSLNEAMVYDLSWDKEVEKNPADKMPIYAENNGINLIDMKGLEFDDPTWEQLLNNLTLEEQINFLGSAYGGTQSLISIGKPADVAKDGPLGIRTTYLNSSLHTISYPCIPLLAASFNDKLVREVGELMGEEMLHSGVNGLYGPGANIHRTTYAGRNYEYYSEDGFLSGKMLNEHVGGIQAKGCYVNVKHIALNDQESNRYGVGIWANEQSIRELYLAAFEYSVKEGSCTGLMSAFNRFGTLWSGAHKGLLTNVLRNEWGFKGFVISDCAWRAYMGVVDGVMAGNDCILDDATLTEYYKAQTNPTIAKAIRESTHRILYVIANGNVMNGMSSNMRIYSVNEWWQDLVVGIQIGLGILSGILILITSLIFIFYKQIKKKYNDNLINKEEKESIAQENYSKDLKFNKFERLLLVGKPWKINRILITILASAISLSLMVGPFFLGYSLSNNNPGGPSDPINPDTPVDPDTPTDPDTPVDPDTPIEDELKTFRFEAETADFVTDIPTAGQGIEPGKTIAQTNYPSGDAFVYNLSKDGAAELTFYIYSDSAKEVNLSITLGLNTKRNLSQIFNYTINDTAIPYEDKEIPANVGPKYFDWTEIEVAKFNVNQGDNILKLTKTTWGLNFDYISLTTTANLEDSRERTNGGHKFADGCSVTHNPTLVAEGEIQTSYCEYCRASTKEKLPMLSEANGYTKTVITPNSDTEFGKANYSIVKYNQTLTFESVIYPNNAKNKIFEAERSTYDGNASRKNEPGVDASGDAYLGSLAGATWNITFDLEVEESCTALLYMRIGRRNDRDVSLSSGKTITLNGTQLDIPTSVIFHQIESESKYMNWEEYEIMTLNFIKGHNTFTLSNAGSAFTNLDYIRLISTTNIDWYVEK